MTCELPLNKAVTENRGEKNDSLLQPSSPSSLFVHAVDYTSTSYSICVSLALLPVSPD